MSSRSLASYSIAAFAGASLLALSLSPASAFTLSGSSPEQSVAATQIDKVWWRGGWGWRGGWRGYGGGWRGYGWGPGYYRPGWGPYYGWGWGPGYCGRSVSY
jgi:hypothetical protein